ncbi:MarR family winged helix-turn-helix transcriptional regulator [Cellulomonas sp. S1-8]|uniref:MarR family winged helix-turn-helix transcriptional regulator n=1 Tax=Cellulomonas sp. S1-8 TaxID=2904790 RepID=UPI002243F632|nr:MarR family transcriptional regulator [Cellulomonas sp. S1-8]UZN03644.1 MarR family transcriptional regulator [Cellulomonas sp. S1-8]
MSETASNPRTAQRSCGADLTHPLARLALLVHTRVTAVADRHGLTPMQARLLALLTDGPCRMTALAQDLGVEKPALTGLVDRAAARDLVRREPVPGDRRATQVVVTPAGASACDAFHAELATCLDDVVATLPPPDRTRYDACTRTIVTAADPQPAPAPVRPLPTDRTPP